MQHHAIRQPKHTAITHVYVNLARWMQFQLGLRDMWSCVDRTWTLHLGYYALLLAAISNEYGVLPVTLLTFATEEQATLHRLAGHPQYSSSADKLTPTIPLDMNVLNALLPPNNH